MSYPIDLDEYREETLRAELLRRTTQRSLGLCDYCGRTSDLVSCKFPERHALAKPAPPTNVQAGVAIAMGTGMYSSASHLLHTLCSTTHQRP